MSTMNYEAVSDAIQDFIQRIKIPFDAITPDELRTDVRQHAQKMSITEINGDEDGVIETYKRIAETTALHSLIILGPPYSITNMAKAGFFSLRLKTYLRAWIDEGIPQSEFRDDIRKLSPLSLQRLRGMPKMSRSTCSELLAAHYIYYKTDGFGAGAQKPMPRFEKNEQIVELFDRNKQSFTGFTEALRDPEFKDAVRKLLASEIS